VGENELFTPLGLGFGIFIIGALAIDFGLLRRKGTHVVPVKEAAAWTLVWIVLAILFGITLDPFIVFTSNAFAILGLRNMYFLLANARDQFHYLGSGLAFVLMWIGVKMILPAINHDWKVPPLVSLVIVISILTISIVASLLHSRRHAKRS